MSLCECKCGGEASPGKRFISGHNARVNTSMKKGKKLSKEAKEKAKETKRLNKLLKEGKIELPFCACGCGGRVSKLGNKYINGHNCRVDNPMSGVSRTPWNKGETKETNDSVKKGGEELSKTKKDFYATEEGQQWLDENKRGKNSPSYGKKSWKNGLTKETNESVKRGAEILSKTKKEFFATEEGQQWLDNNLRGKKNPMYGITGEDHPMYGRGYLFKGENNPMYGKGYLITGENNGMYGKGYLITGKNNPMYGRIGELAPMYGRTGEKSPMYGRKGELSNNWQGGISFEPYCEKFDNNLKERVRDFFDRRCYVCGKSEQDQIEEMIKEGKRPVKVLDVHHVNYNKMVCCNDVKPLFVPLCRSCHAKTRKNREYWEEFFSISLKCLTKDQCFLPKEEKIFEK